MKSSDALSTVEQFSRVTVLGQHVATPVECDYITQIMTQHSAVVARLEWTQ